MSFGRLWTLRSELAGCRGAGPAGLDLFHAVEVDPTPPDHDRPVVGMLVDGRTLIELFTLGPRELTLTEEDTPLSRAEVSGEKPGAFDLGEGFPPVTEVRAGREDAARCSQEKERSFHIKVPP